MPLRRRLFNCIFSSVGSFTLYFIRADSIISIGRGGAVEKMARGFSSKKKVRAKRRQSKGEQAEVSLTGRLERGIGHGEHGPCWKRLAGRAELVAYPSTRTAQESPIRR